MNTQRLLTIYRILEKNEFIDNPSSSGSSNGSINDFNIKFTNPFI